MRGLSAISRHTTVAQAWYTWAMAEPPAPRDLDEIDRELEKLRGFGSTFFVALAAVALLVSLITAVLWLAVF